MSFESLSFVRLNGIQFIGCVENTFVSVDRLEIGNCSFNGLHHKGTALQLNEVSNASITETNFSSNTNFITCPSMQ